MQRMSFKDELKDEITNRASVSNVNGIGLLHFIYNIAITRINNSGYLSDILYYHWLKNLFWSNQIKSY